ncbi:MAG: RT0821/Lpp0805 family surface protein [Desulfobacterales bacterium]|jgi:surface antigen
MISNSRQLKGIIGSAIIVFLSTLITACASTQEKDRSKTIIGGLGGAAAGGFLGAAVGGDTAGIIAGTLIGGLIGGAIGDRLDAADRREAREAAQFSLENSRSGTVTAWNNPDSGNSGTIMPSRTYQTASGQYCREFQQTVTIAGEENQGFGTACRQSDGSWKIVQ